MKKTPKNDSSFDFAKRLQAIGCELSPGQIRAYWRQGAPTTPKEFLQWHGERKATAAGGDAAMKAAKLLKIQKQISILETQDQTAKIELAKVLKQVVDKTYVEAVLRTALFFHLGVYRRIMLGEMPPLLAGLDAVTVETRLIEAMGRVDAELTAHEKCPLFSAALAATYERLRHETPPKPETENATGDTTEHI